MNEVNCNDCQHSIFNKCFKPIVDKAGYSEMLKSTEVKNLDGSCHHYKHKNLLYTIDEYIRGVIYPIKIMYWNIRSFFRNNLLGRLTYGFNLEDTWSLDVSMAKFLAPRLLYLANNVNGYPGTINDEWLEDNDLSRFILEDKAESWSLILNSLAAGFTDIAECYSSMEDYTYQKQQDLTDETMRIFTLFYSNLWY